MSPLSRLLASSRFGGADDITAAADDAELFWETMQKDLEREPTIALTPDVGTDISTHDSNDSARIAGVVRTPLTSHLDSLWG
eukprot:SAG31_NODE_29545_length_393_cov_1.217687_1_plen_82_part_01